MPRRFLKAVFLFVSLGFSGCVVAPVQPAQRISRATAVQVAVDYAVARGYERVAVASVEHDDGLWDVRLGVKPPLRGSLEVSVDPWSAGVVRFTEHVWRNGHHGRGHHHDEDEDEDED